MTTMVEGGPLTNGFFPSSTKSLMLLNNNLKDYPQKSGYQNKVNNN